MPQDLELWFHPFSSFCQKVLVALYENGTPFTPRPVDLGDAGERAALQAIWPMGRFPVLKDGSLTIPEATIIVEHLALRHPGPVALLPADPDLAREARLRDRLFDLDVNGAMQKIVTDRLRPPGRDDPHGVEMAEVQLRNAYGVAEVALAGRTFAAGDAFTMADCAAAPALRYAARVVPFGEAHPRLAAYLARLEARPSFARVIAEAAPYEPLFPAPRSHG